MGAGTQEINRTDEYVEESYQLNLLVKNYGEGIHGSIMNSLKEIDNSQAEKIFGINEPNRVLSEGYRIQGELTVEDFALTGSYNGGEIAIGQVVSSNGKDEVGNIPKDFIQARTFGDRLKRYPEIKVDPKGLYVIRTDYRPKEVKKKNRELKRDIELFGRSEIPVKIHKIKPMETKEEVERYYSSLTQS